MGGDPCLQCQGWKGELWIQIELLVLSFLQDDPLELANLSGRQSFICLFLGFYLVFFYGKRSLC